MWAGMANWRSTLWETWPFHWRISNYQKLKTLSLELVSFFREDPPILLGGGGRVVQACQPQAWEPSEERCLGGISLFSNADFHWSLFSVMCLVRPSVPQTRDSHSAFPEHKTPVFCRGGLVSSFKGWGGGFEGWMLFKHCFQPSPEIPC